MQFDSITIQNFLSIKNIKLDLKDRGLVLIKGMNKDNPALNNNGSGKSSMIEAIVYALYGRTIRGLKGDSVVNNTTGRNMKIFLDLTDDNDDKYRIARYRKHMENKNKSFLFQNGKDITPKSESDFNTAVANLLQADYVTLTSSLLYTAESFKFTSSSDAEMKSTFDNMLGLDVFSNCLEIVKSQIKEVELSLGNTEDKISDNQAQIEKLKLQLEDDKSHLSDWEGNKKSKISSLEDEIKGFQADLEQLQEELVNLQNEKTECEKKVKDLKAALEKRKKALEQVDELKQEISAIKGEITEKESEITSENRKIRNLKSEIGEYNNKIESYEKKVDTYTDKKEALDLTLGQPCPTCGQPLTYECLEPAKAEYDEKISDCKVSIKRTKDKISENEKAIAEHEKNIEALNSELSDLNADLEEFTDLVGKSKKLYDAKKTAEDDYMEATKASYKASSVLESQNTKISARSEFIKVKQKEIKEVQEEENPYLDVIDKHIKMISDREQDIKKLKESIQETMDRKECLEFWKQAYSNTGIKSLILDDITPFLNKQVNKYLNKLTSGHIEAIFSTQTTLKNGDVREKFSIEIKNKDGGGEYSANSGGEKKRVDIAVNLAMQDLVASRSNKRMNIAVFDEVFDALDDTGIESVIQLLQELSEEKSTIFVVSHNEHLQSYFSEVITVKKENGCSTLADASDLEEEDEEDNDE